jgi:hypothetical protein
MTPVLHPWHRRVLRLLVRRGPLTAAAVGELAYAKTARFEREGHAARDLLELRKRGLVDRDHGRPERWHAGLFAAEAITETKEAAPWLVG